MGSHRWQFPGHAEPLSAIIIAAKYHVSRRQATSRHPPEVPSKQRVAGSNPAGRAELRLYLHGAACAGRLLDRRPVAEVDRGRTGIGHASCTEGEWCSPVAITIALGQQIISAPMLPDSTVGSSRRLDRAPVSANDPLRSRITYDTMRSIAGGPQG
jgi:hypothetical protein